MYDISMFRKAEVFAGFGLLNYSTDGHLFYVSDGAKHIFGLDGSEFTEANLKRILLEDYRQLLRRTKKMMVLCGCSIDIKFKIKRSTDGQLINISYKAYYDHENKTVFGVVRDITSEVTAENKLKESERRISTLMSNLPGIAYRCKNDKDWTMEFISDGCMELTGYCPDDFIDNKTLCFNDIIHPEHRERVWDEWQQALETKQYIQLEYPVIIASGAEKWFWEKGCGIYSETGELLALEGFISDITDLKNSQMEMIEFEKKMVNTQKFESIGVLAGGIAHDFNNILMVIKGNAELALQELPPDSSVGNIISSIEDASSKAAELCSQILTYSGQSIFKMQYFNLVDLVSGMIQLLKTSISKKAELILKPENNLPVVIGDASQIRQIIMNLVINASEAIGDNPGSIIVSTGVMNCTSDYLKDAYIGMNSEEGRYVWLEVSDTGCGMDSDVISRVFEPFFTTKFTGRGLGMSVVFGIIKNHKGGLKIISEPAVGTTFRVLLPAFSDLNTFGSKHDGQSESFNCSETVLVVDLVES